MIKTDQKSASECAKEVIEMIKSLYNLLMVQLHSQRNGCHQIKILSKTEMYRLYHVILVL